MNQLLDMSVTAVRQSFGQTVSQTVNQLISPSVSQSVSHSVCLSVCLSDRITVCRRQDNVFVFVRAFRFLLSLFDPFLFL